MIIYGFLEQIKWQGIYYNKLIGVYNMKICYLADGNSQHTKKWCDYFSKYNNEIYVISLNNVNISSNNVNVINLGYKIDNKTSFSKIKYLINIFKIKKIINKIKPDFVHAHYASSYGLIGSLINYHPYIISMWGSDVFDFPNKNIITKSIIKYNFKCADYLFSTSKFMATEARKYTSKNVFVTPFGINLNEFKPSMRNKDDSKIIIGINKSLEEIYGIKFLLEGFYKILDKYPNVLLKIIGDGSCKNHLEKLVKDYGIENKVIFYGRLEKDELIRELSTFNIAVYPSLKESFGVAALEAQACGIPVIVSDEGGLLETTLPNKSSLVVRKSNSDDIAAKLDYLLSSEDIRCNIGKIGRKFVEDNFDMDKNFMLINNLYMDIINNNL